MVDKVLAMNLNTEQMKRYMGGKDPHKFTSKSSSISGPVSRSSESGEEQAAEEENSESSSDGENSSSSDYDDESDSSHEESDVELSNSTDYFFALETQHKDFVRSMV